MKKFSLSVYPFIRLSDQRNNETTKQRGSVFLVLFGALGVIGILGVGMTTLIKGPLTSSVKLTRSNSAQAQMAIAAQSAVMAATGLSGSGDCDTDNYVEPVEWRIDGTKPSPTGGGLIPLGIGVTRTSDPWGSDYGYCVWDHGPTLLNASCQQGTPGTNRRLAGTDSKLYTSVAIISAGPDKAFTTTCRTFAAADVNANGALGDTGDLEMVSKAAASDDDLIFTYTYEEATGASGGLWQLKSSDANTATINKAIEVPQAKFTGTSMMNSLGYVQNAAVSCTGLGNVSYNDPASGNCYYRVDVNVDWPTAKSACEANGGYLAVVDSLTEKNIIVANMISATPSWVGATDSDTEGKWVWTGGELKGIQFWQGNNAANGGTAINGAYSNWLSGEPGVGTSDTEDCMVHGNTWNDISCTTLRTYICEKTGASPLTMQNGLRIADASVVTTCNSTNTGVLRRTASGANLEICDGTTWLAGGGSAIGTIIDNFSDGIANYVRNNIFLGKNAGGESVTGGGNIILAADNYASATLTTGWGNSILGTYVLRNITEGSANTALGYYTMENAPTASRTAAFGNYACSKLGNGTANNDNTCIGTAALLDKVSTGITSVGRYSGYNTIGAVRAVWLGGDAGNRNTSGLDNTAIGNYALDNVTVNGASTALGHAVLTGATAGSNTGVGSGAMGSVTSATRNVAVGMSSLGALGATASDNTAIGYNSLRLLNNAAALRNTGAGYSALYASTAGADNIAIGSYAAASLTVATSSRNVAVGRDVMRDKAASTSDNVAIGATAVKGPGSTLNNTGIGWSALSVVRSPSNVAIGYSASRLQNSATATVINTAVGSEALMANVNMANNVAAGYDALRNSTAVSNSVAIGYESLLNHTSTAASNITAVGYQALRSNTGLTLTTAVGHQALYNNTTGTNNLGIGYQALYAGTTASNNMAAGSQALYATTHASGNNTAIGSQAGYAATGLNNAAIVGSQAAYGATAQTADAPVAIGYRSLYATGAASVTGATSFGSQALLGGAASGSSFGFRSGYNGTTDITSAGYLSFGVTNSGTRNTALGALAMTGGTGGASNYNTAAGYRAMVNNVVSSGSDGSYNTAIGAYALENSGLADSNIAIGYAAYDGTMYSQSTAIGSRTDIGGSNSTAIGYGATTSAADTIRLGNASITAIEGQVAWTFPSDRRLKKDITPSDLGLDFIMGLKPVSYRLKQGNGRLDYGFLAQDVEKSLDGRQTNMINRLNDEIKTYQLRSNDLVAPIVKAIQERQAKIEDLKRQIAELKNCEGGAE